MAGSHLKLLKGPINLLRGWPSPSLLPNHAFLTGALTALSTPSILTSALLYGPDGGYGPLKSEISRWLSVYYNSPDDPSRICITGGASQNLACVLNVFTDPGVTKRVWMVAPCYFLACRIFEDASFAGKLRAVPEDEEGLDVAFLEKEMLEVERCEGKGKILKPPRPWSKTFDHIIYAVPDFSNPSGKTMSLRRREQLVLLARNHNALIITDDVYDRLLWPSSTTSDVSPKAPDRALLPRLTDIDRNLPQHPSDPLHFGNTLSSGTFSKIVGPGVRTGWVDAQPTLAYGLSQCGSNRSGGCPSQMVATMITQLLKDGSLQGHISNVLVPSYAKRWSKMMTAIAEHLIPLGVSVSRVSLEGKDVFGGYFIWFELPIHSMSAERVAALAKEEENLIVAHGNLFEVYGDEEAARFDRWLRVCFAWEEEGKLVEGIERLGVVIKNGLHRDSNESGKSTESLRTPMGFF